MPDRVRRDFASSDQAHSHLMNGPREIHERHDRRFRSGADHSRGGVHHGPPRFRTGGSGARSGRCAADGKCRAGSSSGRSPSDAGSGPCTSSGCPDSRCGRPESMTTDCRLRRARCSRWSPSASAQEPSPTWAPALPSCRPQVFSPAWAWRERTARTWPPSRYGSTRTWPNPRRPGRRPPRSRRCRWPSWSSSSWPARWSRSIPC